MAERVITDDEVLFRKIPPGDPWFKPPGRITTANFKLHATDEGISLYRASIVSASDVLAKPGSKPGSSIAQATACAIRSAKNAAGVPLRLDVIPIGDENDPGHCEIRGEALCGSSQSAAKALRKLFTLMLGGSRPQ